MNRRTRVMKWTIDIHSFTICIYVFIQCETHTISSTLFLTLNEALNVNELSRLSTLNSTLRKREQGEQIIVRSWLSNEDGLSRNDYRKKWTKPRLLDPRLICPKMCKELATTDQPKATIFWDSVPGQAGCCSSYFSVRIFVHDL
jgi:hypothetical protein